MMEEEKTDPTFLYTIDLNVKKNKFVIKIKNKKLNIGFSERDSRMNDLENKGDFKIEIINNDKNYRNMKLLIDLKNLFSFQLPKMPKEYITRLVFNVNHESMVILNNSDKLIGGICFRVFKEQKFTEIAFLAVSSSQQVKGYGTRLLNHFKNFVIGKESNYLLTYADNYAIGFFKKQGFSKEIKVPFCLWNGVIKHYDGGIFMGCDLNVKIDYCQISREIKIQKKIIRDKIMEICINKIRFSGLQFSDEKPKSIESIPGINQSGWILDDNNNDETLQNTKIQLLLQRIVNLLLKNRHAWPFIQPVNLEEVPDYYTIIKNPIDLKSIEFKVQNRKYENIHDFIDDVNRIFTNARLYNQAETIFVKNANLLESFIKPYLEELMEKKL